MGQAKSEDTEARAYKAAVEAGRLWQAVRKLTLREGGGVRHPDDMCSKAHRPVVDVLWDKQPQMRDLEVGVDSGTFKLYKKALQSMPI